MIETKEEIDSFWILTSYTNFLSHLFLLKKIWKLTIIKWDSGMEPFLLWSFERSSPTKVRLVPLDGLPKDLKMWLGDLVWGSGDIGAEPAKWLDRKWMILDGREGGGGSLCSGKRGPNSAHF